MQHEDKSKEQLITDLHDLRKRVAELEKEKAERKRAEDALQESDDKYRRLAESIPGMVFQYVLHEDGSFSLPYVNERIMQYAAILPEAVMAEPALLFTPVHHDDMEMIQQAISISAQTLHDFSLEHRLIDVNGQLRWFRVESRPQLLSNGDILWNGVSIDITERKLAEEALQQSKAYLAATIESIPFEFWVIGPDGRYTMQNRICKERYGDIIGNRPEDICPNESILSIWQDNNRRASSGELVEGEVKFVFGDEERYFYNVVAPIRDADRALGIIGINVDITDRKLLEAALEKANEELESQVEERTKELGAKTRRLEEFNSAMKVLLKQREEDRTELEESILLNVKNLIVPYVEKLKKGRLGDDQMTYLTILESHLREITSPFTKRLSEKYLGLTPVEVHTAGLIREGKTTQEIADLLCVSENTVSSTRFHIRKKLGLSNKKINLRYYLNSLAK